VAAGGSFGFYLGEGSFRKHAIGERVSTRFRKQKTSESEKKKVQTHMSKQVFPQAPSPTITNLRLISAIAVVEEMCD
jgi:hypothetical protein